MNRVIRVIFVWFLLIQCVACRGREEGQSKGVVEKREGEQRQVQKMETESSPKGILAAPEIISVKLTPSSPRVNDAIKAEVLTKGNASATYQWSLNGRQLDVSGVILSSGEFKRGDKISLTVTPFIGNQKGNAVTVFTYIFNSPPKIVSEIKNSKYKDSSFIYQVKASDPDGDTLAYSLKKAPEGMVIDKSTGLIQWKVTEKDAGRHTVTVQVSDGHGGEALYNFEVTIGLEGR